MTVPTIHAADSAEPRPALYDPERFRAWLVYIAGDTPHVWSRAEVAALHAHGIDGFAGIVVPPQSWPWALGEEDVLLSLVREAEAWGYAKGAPLIFDVEEWQAARMGSQLPNVLGLFRGYAIAAGYEPIVYGSWRTIASRPQGNLEGLLAEWPAGPGNVPADVPELAPGLFGHQYAGGVQGGRIDLSVLAAPVTLAATNFAVRSGLVYIDDAGHSFPVMEDPTVPLPTDHTPETEATPEPALTAPEELAAEHAETNVQADAAAVVADVKSGELTEADLALVEQKVAELGAVLAAIRLRVTGA